MNQRGSILDYASSAHGAMRESSIVELIVEKFGEDADVVSQLIGFQPSIIAYEQGLMPLRPTSPGKSVGEEAAENEGWPAQPLRPPPYWKFEPLSTKEISMEERFAALLTLLERHVDGVRRCAVRFPTHIRCGVSFEDSRAAMRLSESVISRVARLGLPMEFDVCFRVKSENEVNDT